MSESLEERLARIGDEAEAGEEDQTERPIPAHVTVSRPNKGKRARSKVLQVRLAPAEYEVLEAGADELGMTVSAFARQQLMAAVGIRTYSEPMAGIAEKFVQAAESIDFTDPMKALLEMRQTLESTQFEMSQLHGLISSLVHRTDIGFAPPSLNVEIHEKGEKPAEYFSSG